MIRNKAIFAGTSNTIGIGLELELSKRFQDDEYLENCKNIPPIEEEKTGYESYTSEDIEIHRKYRWPRLVCDYFGLEEININDPVVENPIDLFNTTRHAVDIIFGLYDRREEEEIKKLLSETKYIFLEFGYIRWWDAKLHGVKTDFKWPSTPLEIEKFLNDSSIDMESKHKAIDWLNNLNPIELWEKTLNLVKEMKKSFPEIKFTLLAWGVNPDVFNIELTKELLDDFLKISNTSDIMSSYSIGDFLNKNKLQIKDVVKAYNKKYEEKWLYIDHHANKKGNEIIANQVINKLQNEIRNLHTI